MKDMWVGRRFTTKDNFVGEIVFISDDKDNFRNDFVVCIKWISTTNKNQYDLTALGAIKENFDIDYYKWVN